jgi:hypothetical protein
MAQQSLGGLCIFLWTSIGQRLYLTPCGSVNDENYSDLCPEDGLRLLEQWRPLERMQCSARWESAGPGMCFRIAIWTLSDAPDLTNGTLL